MSARVAAICRHPIKGFTPEPLERVALEPGRGFPDDRVYAVEDGPSGFDPDRPAFVPKQNFTVLARLPRVAAVHTRYRAGRLQAAAPGARPFTGDLRQEAGRTAFAAWLTAFLGDELRGPLQVLPAPASHRFTDHPQGQVSIVSLASVRDLGRRLGREVDPLRFRANIYVDGWPAWAEHGWTGEALTLGGVALEVFKPIVRCVATHVNPASAEPDLDLTRALFELFAHLHMGVYARVTSAGQVARGDAASTPAAAA